MNDIFRPRLEPARWIYDAFQDEAKHRKSRTFDEWHEAEKQRVWREARDYAQQYEKRVPTMADITRAEISACGHSDYGASWAYGIARLLQSDFVHP